MRYLLTHLDDAWALTVVHLWLSLLPVLIAGLLVGAGCDRRGTKAARNAPAPADELPVADVLVSGDAQPAGATQPNAAAETVPRLVPTRNTGNPGKRLLTSDTTAEMSLK